MQEADWRPLRGTSEAAGETRRRAVKQLHARVLEHAAVFAQERQLLQPGKLGAQVAAELIKADRLDRYTLQAKAHNQEPIRALDLDEPSADTPSVDMLAALPFRERQFYSDENNVVNFQATSDVISQELQQRYGFVGGSYAEYVAYFNRADVDASLWH